MNKIIDYFRRNVENYPDKNAIIFGGQSITYRKLGELVDSFSENLINLKKGSTISIFHENSIDFVISYLGILNSGMITHLIPINLSKEKIQEQLEIANSKFVITSNSLLDRMENIKSGCKIITFQELDIQDCELSSSYDVEDDVAYLIFTSGTTGKPKGASVTQSNTIFTTENIINILNYNNADVNVLPLPLTHSFGLGCLHSSLFVGSTLILLENATNTKKILEHIKNYNATTLASVPLTLTKILKEHENCSDYLQDLRLVITNSTSIPKKTVMCYRDILKTGILATYYGLTEASRSTFMIFAKPGKETSVGKPPEGIVIKIENKVLDERKVGEILIKGKNVIKNYWNNSEADKNIVDGWLRTGDLGHKDAEGYLYLDGRMDYVINIVGEKVVPEEVEEVVRVLIDVEDVVAVGTKNEMYGEIMKMFVKKSPNSKITKSDILSYCIKNLESFKVPREIEFVDDFPQNEFGKIERYRLSEKNE